MKLPNAEKALTTRKKVLDYLLAEGHPHGRHKAAFFTRFGFDAARWEELAEVLREHAILNEVAKAETTPFGVRYTIEGQMNTPDHRQPLVRSVWFVEKGEKLPRLVTAYPV